MKNPKNKSVALVVAFRDFRDEEYFVPKKILEEAGINVLTVSTKKDIAIGADGGETEVDVLLEDLKPGDFEALVFIGGPGALQYLDSTESYRVIKETKALGRILGAICIAPVILAKAGVLEGKKATVWSSDLDRFPVRVLEAGGAVYQDNPVVVDSKLVTANGPAAAGEFGRALVDLVK